MTTPRRLPSLQRPAPSGAEARPGCAHRERGQHMRSNSPDRPANRPCADSLRQIRTTPAARKHSPAGDSFAINENASIHYRVCIACGASSGSRSSPPVLGRTRGHTAPQRPARTDGQAQPAGRLTLTRAQAHPQERRSMHGFQDHRCSRPSFTHSASVRTSRRRTCRRYWTASRRSLIAVMPIAMGRVTACGRSMPRARSAPGNPSGSVSRRRRRSRGAATS